MAFRGMVSGAIGKIRERGGRESPPLVTMGTGATVMIRVRTRGCAAAADWRKGYRLGNVTAAWRVSAPSAAM